MTRHAWSRLRQVLAELDRHLWRTADNETPHVARVIMTFKCTTPLTSSRYAAPVPPSANDLAA